MDTLIFGVRSVYAGGTLMPERPALNVIGATAVDNPAADRTDMTITTTGLLQLDNNDWVSASLPDGHSLKNQTTTTNNTTTTLQSFTLTDLRTSTFYVVVEAYQTAGTNNPDAAEFQLKGVWRRAGGSLVVVKAPVVVDSNPNANGTAWTAVLDVSSTSVRVRVTGDTGKTIRWSCVRTEYEG
jgi:hypothetical protein